MKFWQPRFKKLPRFICVGPHGFRISLSAKWRRQNTQYPDDRSNWVCCCAECYKEIEEYWTERWDEYRAGCL